MSKPIIENTNPAQKEWNAYLVSRNKQLTKELKEFRTVSTITGCSSAQLLAMSQLYRIQTSPAYGIIRDEQEWNNLFAMIDALYGNSLAASLQKYAFTLQELKVCYLIRARIKNNSIAILFNITTQSVIKAKQRLKQKFGLMITDKFDVFIQQL